MNNSVMVKVSGFLFHFLIVFCLLLSAQSNVDAVKAEAMKEMKVGKFGEAIDLLNKYISAKPTNYDGYNLRGLCYEKRGQYEYAVFDYRAARKLAPNNNEVITNLNRATTAWYAILNNKIEGHRREIAINPNIAVNYLEIGKCYKHMGEWQKAEDWYDQYLKREDPSSDELIRYCEILVKTGHIQKGEKWLKRYCEKFPKDHRLWSRYGYFTYWLGKRKIAVEAFKNALELRPYFKEAIDGLRMAEDEPYIYTYYDTTYRDEKKRNPEAKEYIIDRYFRIVKNNPADSTTRYALIEELIKVNRYEEAYQQLQIMSKDNNMSPRFTELWDKVSETREKYFQEQLVTYKTRLEKDPKDRDAALKIAEYHARMLNYDSAVVVVSDYLAQFPESGGEDDVRLILARYSAWNYQFEDAITQLNILLKKDPNNLTYQLLRAQISVWTTQDQDQAKVYLNNVLNKEPNNVQALVSLATILIRERSFNDALAYIDKAKVADPKSKEIETIENFYAVSMELEKDRKNFEILVEGRNLALNQDCEGALVKYDEYFTKIPSPNKIELLEYADVNSCAKNYSKALEIYDKLLEGDYDYDVSLLRAKTLLWGGDSVQAQKELERLTAEDTTNFEAKLYLAESHERMRQYDVAREMYEALYASTEDSVKRHIVQLRIGWLPVSGVSNAFANFPTYTRLSPQATYYRDNQKLNFYSTTGNVEFGITDFLAVGLGYTRGKMNGPSYSRTLTTFKGNVILNLSSSFSILAGLGNLQYDDLTRRRVNDFTLRYAREKVLSMQLSYDHTDAASYIYSAKLANPLSRLAGQFYRFYGTYSPSSINKFMVNFAYITLSDGNAGNDFSFRFGRKFYDDVMGGYEYDYTNYARASSVYYAPQGFEAHALWAEYLADKTEDYEVTLGGKIGYIPASDFILRELSAAAIYKPNNTFFVSARLTYGGSFRFESSYNYISGFLLAYISL